MTERYPSEAEIRRLIDAGYDLAGGWRTSNLANAADQEAGIWLPLMMGISAAIDPFRDARAVRGWSPRLLGQVARLAEWFDDFVASEGWSWVVGPDREQFAAQRLAEIGAAEDRIRSLAMAILLRSDALAIPRHIQEWAHEGRHKGLEAADLEPDAAKGEIVNLVQDLATRPRFALADPGETPNLISPKQQAVEPIWRILEGIEASLQFETPPLSSPQTVPLPPPGTPPAPMPLSESEIVEIARRIESDGKKARKNEAGLVRRFADRDEISYDEVKEYVHYNETVSDEAVEKNAGRTNRTLEKMGARLRFDWRAKRIRRIFIP